MHPIDDDWGRRFGTGRRPICFAASTFYEVWRPRRFPSADSGQAGARTASDQWRASSLDCFSPHSVGTRGSTLPVGSVDDFEIGSITRVADGKFYLARVPEGFLALYQKCPHLGCVVPWEPTQQTEDNLAEQGRFNCPCHGSIYNRYGVNVAGPAPRPMDLMEITIENGTIMVSTGKITR